MGECGVCECMCVCVCVRVCVCVCACVCVCVPSTPPHLLSVEEEEAAWGRLEGHARSQPALVLVETD